MFSIIEYNSRIGHIEFGMQNRYFNESLTRPYFKSNIARRVRTSDSAADSFPSKKGGWKAPPPLLLRNGVGWGAEAGSGTGQDKLYQYTCLLTIDNISYLSVC